MTEPIQIGKREDLADMMSIIDVKETPFISRIRKSKAPTNTLFDWMVDRYDLPKLGGTVDGTDVTNFENHGVFRLKLHNYIEVFRRSDKVSRLAQDISNVAGVKNEIANGGMKKLVEIKRDMEATLLSDQDAQADNGIVEYLTCALGKWISLAGPSTFPITDAAYRPSSGQINTTAVASLIEDTDLQGMLQAIFDSTGFSGEHSILAGSVFRRRFTDMTRTIASVSGSTSKIRTFAGAQSSKRVDNTTTIYAGDYGSLDIETSSWIGWNGLVPDKERAYVLDYNKLHLRYGKTPSIERLTDEGGGPRFFVEAVAGLQVDNPAGLGKFDPA
jgi:hypothetical protein